MNRQHTALIAAVLGACLALGLLATHATRADSTELAEVAPQRQGSACSLLNGDFSNGLDNWTVTNVTLDNAVGNPAPSARFYRPSSAYQLRQDVYIPPGTTWVEFKTNSCEYEGACSGG